MSLFAALSNDHTAAILCVLALLFCIACLAVVPSFRQRRTRTSSSYTRTSPQFFSRSKRMTTH